MALGSFIAFLDDRGLLDFNTISDDGDEGFETRFRIQKYVYLAELFGLENDYRYTMYRYGPYSSALADDYYELGENPELFNEIRDEPLPDSFNEDAFLQVLGNRDHDWLEVSSTLIDQRARFGNDEELVEHIESIKCNYTSDYIKEVLGELQRLQLIS